VASTVRSRRRATAIAVPGTMALVLTGAFVAAPALAASNSPTSLPSICATSQSAATSASSSSSASPSGTTASPSASSTTASPSASSTTAGSVANGAKTSASSSASSSASAGATGSASASAGASASASPSASSSSNGFWGWLNGVWTWIFGDATIPTHSANAIVADASKTTGSTKVENVAAVSTSHSSSTSKHSSSKSSTTTSTISNASTSTGSSSDQNCISAASAAALAKKAAANGTSEGVYAGAIPWVMKTSVLTLYDLTYNGVKTVSVLDSSTGQYVDEQVLDFTASKLTIDSMVTYSIQNGQTVYNNAGSGTTTTLVNPHLMTVSLSGSLFGLLPQDYTPTNQPPLPVGLTIPLIPVVFTGVTTQLAYLHTDTISVPGFDGFAQTGVASPQ